MHSVIRKYWEATTQKLIYGFYCSRMLCESPLLGEDAHRLVQQWLEAGGAVG
jgi:hypothetical protein